MSVRPKLARARPIARQFRADSGGTKEAQQADRHIDQKDQGPRPNTKQETADRRTQRRSEEEQASSDGRDAFAGTAVGTQQDVHRERNQRGTAKTLQHSRRDQHGQRWGEGTRQGRQGEACHADEIDAACPVAFRKEGACRETEREGQEIATDDPLRSREISLEAACDHGKGDVDDTGVNHAHERTCQQTKQHESSEPLLHRWGRRGNGGFHAVLLVFWLTS